MLQAIMAFVAAAAGAFYFSWAVRHDLVQRDLSHTRCAPRVTRQERPATFWFIVSLSAGLAILFAWLALQSAYRIVTQLG